MTTKNILFAVVLLVVALLSFAVITKYATSTAISALPGDATTIADQVADLTGPLLLVICAIYLEKFFLQRLVSFPLNIDLSEAKKWIPSRHIR